MSSLFVAWQDKRAGSSSKPATRRWFPIGQLDVSPEGRHFVFRYTRGALKAREQAGFEPLEAFPELRKVYESPELFSVFRNRVPNPKRDDYAATVERLGLSPDHVDPFEILAVTEGARQTDNLEVFPKIHKEDDGSFRCRFFLHGWRYVNEWAKKRLGELEAGEALQVALELNNPATGPAIQLQTQEDYYVLGWAPRYLVLDMLEALAKAPSELSASVLRLNPPPAPYNQRVMIELAGRLPEAFEPMSSEDYQPLLAA